MAMTSSNRISNSTNLLENIEITDKAVSLIRRFFSAKLMLIMESSIYQKYLTQKKKIQINVKQPIGCYTF